jgi:hypothetical protein
LAKQSCKTLEEEMSTTTVGLPKIGAPSTTTGSVNMGMGGLIVGLVGVGLLMAGIFTQFLNVSGGESGNRTLIEKVGVTFAFLLPSVLLLILGWLFYASYSSNINKSRILWWMAMTSLITSNIALVASLFQVKLTTKFSP